MGRSGREDDMQKREWKEYRKKKKKQHSSKKKKRREREVKIRTNTLSTKNKYMSV